MKIELPRKRFRVRGFRFAGVRAGLRSDGRPDVALAVADEPATVAAAFTKNRFAAAPIEVCRSRVRNGRAQAIVVNTVSANAGTGRSGLDDCRRVSRAASVELGVPDGDVLPCSTGKIGIPLDVAKIEAGIVAGKRALSANGIWDFASAICTTDAAEKVARRSVEIGGRRVEVVGAAKGAGMIHPRMATTLAFLFTDARIEAKALGGMLRRGLAMSFNVASVDGDMSTNDAAFVLASGASGGRALREGGRGAQILETAISEVLQDLARLIVLDGEGASRIARIVVRGAKSDRQADQAARAVGNSMLFKAALAGGDPNWGRIAAAVGYSGAAFRRNRLHIAIEGISLYRDDAPTGAEGAAHRAMQKDEVLVEIDLGVGAASATLLASDLTPEYVRFNAEYSS